MSDSDEHGILVVDDHPVVRRGFRQLLDRQSGLTVRGEAATPAEAIDQISEREPDLVLMDITLDGGASGLELIKKLRDLQPDLPVLVVSMHDEALYAGRALAAGADGYIMKRVPDEQLVEAVRQVLAGDLYVSDAIRERLLESVGDDEEAVHESIGELSDRELEVFLLVGQGFAPRHIAERLHLSVKTVETHRRHLKQKLGLSSSTELTRYAIAWRVEHRGEEE